MKISKIPTCGKIILAAVMTLLADAQLNATTATYQLAAKYDLLPDTPQNESSETKPEDFESYKSAYIARYAFFSLPYADENQSKLTDLQKKDIADELARRLEDYKLAVSMIEARMKNLGYPVDEEVSQDEEGKKTGKTSSSEKVASDDSKASSSKSEKKKTDDMSFTLADGTTADASDGVLIVDHENGTGTAFLARMKDRYFIVTNLHMILNSDGLTFKTKNGSSVDFPDIVFVAKGLDAVLIPINKIPDGCVALDIMEDVANVVKRGDAVVACGNSQGGEVLRRSPGEILAIGPSVVETNCAIFKGNSGSPIFHQKTGKVVGVISHATTSEGKLSDTVRRDPNSPIKSKIRYFGQRVDNVKRWERMKLSDLNQQSKDLEIFHKKLAIIKHFEDRGKLLIFDDLNYADFNKISRILSGTASSIGAVKAARRQYYEKTAGLLRQEVALIKARKFSSVFESEVDALIKEIELHRDLCIERERSQN